MLWRGGNIHQSSIRDDSLLGLPSEFKCLSPPKHDIGVTVGNFKRPPEAVSGLAVHPPLEG